jgi:hypothetical protein
VIIVEGRGRDVDHQIGMLADQLVHRANPVQRVIAEIPDILADGESDLFALEWDDLPFVGRLKIPVFIKHVIVGQTGFVRHAFDLFLIEKPCGIEEILPLAGGIAGRRADDDADAVGFLADAIDCGIGLRDEVIEFQEVTGRITANG